MAQKEPKPPMEPKPPKEPNHTKKLNVSSNKKGELVRKMYLVLQRRPDLIKKQTKPGMAVLLVLFPKA